MIKIDYILHFLAGIAIGAVTSVLLDPLWSIPVSLVIGLGKELYDLKIRHTQFEIAEAACTLSGGMLYWFLRAIEIVFKG